MYNLMMTHVLCEAMPSPLLFLLRPEGPRREPYQLMALLSHITNLRGMLSSRSGPGIGSCVFPDADIRRSGLFSENPLLCAAGLGQPPLSPLDAVTLPSPPDAISPEHWSQVPAGLLGPSVSSTSRPTVFEDANRRQPCPAISSLVSFQSGKQNTDNSPPQRCNLPATSFNVLSITTMADATNIAADEGKPIAATDNTLAVPGPPEVEINGIAHEGGKVESDDDMKVSPTIHNIWHSSFLMIVCLMCSTQDHKASQQRFVSPQAEQKSPLL